VDGSGTASQIQVEEVCITRMSPHSSFVSSKTSLKNMILKQVIDLKRQRALNRDLKFIIKKLKQHRQINVYARRIMFTFSGI
jgi:hypothetical protein